MHRTSLSCGVFFLRPPTIIPLTNIKSLPQGEAKFVILNLRFFTYYYAGNSLSE